MSVLIQVEVLAANIQAAGRVLDEFQCMESTAHRVPLWSSGRPGVDHAKHLMAAEFVRHAQRLVEQLRTQLTPLPVTARTETKGIPAMPIMIDARALVPLLSAEQEADDAWNEAANAQVVAHGLIAWEQAPAVQEAQRVWMQSMGELAAELRALVNVAVK